MSKPFDASLKELIEGYPADWVRLVTGAPPPAVDVIDADVSSVSAAAD
jgi:predicted transposase YdaD